MGKRPMGEVGVKGGTRSRQGIPVGCSCLQREKKEVLMKI